MKAMKHAPAHQSILTVENLSVKLGTESIIENLSFTVQSGEYITIIGSNGSGKTTLFQALIGIIPYGGTIRWDPDVVIGYVPQRLDLERNIPPSVKKFFESKGVRAPREDLLVHLKLVGLSPTILRQPLGSLSGGEFQRALVAFALIGDTNVLLFDEPTASIDKPSEEHIYTTLHQLQAEKGLTILTISHDLNFVQRFAEKVLCLNRGKHFFGVPGDVLQPERLADFYGNQQYKFFQHKHEH